MILMIYVPCPSRDLALKMGRTLIEERLVACVQVLGEVSSLYHWEGRIQEDTECLLLAKTDSATWPRAQSRIQELHPYDVPCIAAYAAQDVNESYKAWVTHELSLDSLKT